MNEYSAKSASGTVSLRANRNRRPNRWPLSIRCRGQHATGRPRDTAADGCTEWGRGLSFWRMFHHPLRVARFESSDPPAIPRTLIKHTYTQLLGLMIMAPSRAILAELHCAVASLALSKSSYLEKSMQLVEIFIDVTSAKEIEIGHRRRNCYRYWTSCYYFITSSPRRKTCKMLNFEWEC